MAKHRGVFNILVVILLMQCFSQGMSQPAPSVSYSHAPEDTLWVYDTVWVYDTIYEYQTIYDTLWVYDTIYIDTTFDNLKPLTPLKAQKVEPNYQELYKWYYASSAFQAQKRTFQKRPRAKTKRSIYYKMRYKSREKQRAPKQKKLPPNFESRVTLLPTRGAFNPQLLKRGVISPELYGGITQYKWKYQQSEGLTLSDSLNSNLSTALGNEFGLKLNYNLYQYGAQIGVGISSVKQSLSYSELMVFIDSVSNWNTFQVQEQRIDTIWFYNADSLIAGDTVKIPFLDTVNIIRTDSTPIYDTLSEWKSRQALNQYRLLEVPMIFSYELGFSRTAYVFKGGVVHSFLLSTKGKYYAEDGTVKDIRNALHLRNYTVFLYLGLSMVYEFAPRHSLVLEGFYKYPIQAFNRDKHLKISYTSYGMQLGYRYRF